MSRFMLRDRNDKHKFKSIKSRCPGVQVSRFPPCQFWGRKVKKTSKLSHSSKNKFVGSVLPPHSDRELADEGSERELIAQIEGKLDGLGKRIRMFKRVQRASWSRSLSHSIVFFRQFYRKRGLGGSRSRALTHTLPVQLKQTVFLYFPRGMKESALRSKQASKTC